MLARPKARAKGAEDDSVNSRSSPLFFCSLFLRPGSLGRAPPSVLRCVSQNTK